MTETYGAQAIPISASPGAAVTVTPTPADPLLTYLLSYFQAAANARLGTEFGALMTPNRAIPQDESPVKFVFEHNPEPDNFNDNKLPALYLFRDGDGGGTIEQMTSDWQVSTENLTLLWVLPTATQERQASRARFPSKLFHLFSALIDRNRDKAWIVDGDTDPLAETEGSDLAKYAKFYRLRMAHMPRRRPLSIALEGQKPLVYAAWETLLEVRELLTLDEERDAALGGLTATITTAETSPGGTAKTLGVLSITNP